MTGAKKLVFGAVVAMVALMTAGGIARAQVYHQHPGATVVGDAEPATGATVGFADNMVRLLGYARFNASTVSDFGLAVSLDHFDPDLGDDGWRFGLSADFKYAIVPSETSMPFDLSLNAGLGFQSGADVTNINIPVGGIISRPLELSNGRILLPYGAIYLVMSHISLDLPPGLDDSDTELDVELRLGASIELGAGMSAFANIHIGDDEMFALGINASL